MTLKADFPVARLSQAKTSSYRGRVGESFYGPFRVRGSLSNQEPERSKILVNVACEGKQLHGFKKYQVRYHVHSTEQGKLKEVYLYRIPADLLNEALGKGAQEIKTAQ